MPEIEVTGLPARVRAWSDRPIVSAGIAGGATVVYLIVRLIVSGHGQVSRFVMAELPYANPAKVPPGLPILPKNGYDGQFFYRLALNPSSLHPTAYGITFDNAFRLQRIGYPVLAWLVSFGHHPWVPASLVIVNVAAITAIGLLGGLIARDAGRHAAWGLLLVGYWGFVFSTGRDTAEPVAAAFMLAGVLAYRRKHPVIAGLLLAYGALSRETVMVFVAALAIIRVIDIVRRRARPGADDLAWITPGMFFVAWQLVIYQVTGSVALTADTSSNSGHLLSPMLHALSTNIRQISIHHAAIDAWILEFVALVVIIVCALAALRTTTVPVHERLALILFVIELFVLSPDIWNGVADLRSLDDVYLFSILILLGSRVGSRVQARRLRIPVMALIPVLFIVTVHRIVSL